MIRARRSFNEAAHGCRGFTVFTVVSKKLRAALPSRESPPEVFLSRGLQFAGGAGGVVALRPITVSHPRGQERTVG